MTKQMSIEGVVHHVHAIIAQGRVEEFFAECRKNGFLEISAPDGLIAFTREFIGQASPLGKGLTFNEPMSDAFKQMMDQSLRIERRYIDECTC